MGRKSTLSNDELISRISRVFRDVGYEGASLSLLSQATGLQRASLYHRFPRGKEQMACEVLEAAGAWLSEHILKPLKGPGDPKSRILAMVKELDEFYSGGRQACLLNMLSSSRIQGGPFTQQIQSTFLAWITALRDVLLEAGLPEAEAQARAERSVMMLQGSLVLARGMGTEQPFKSYLETLLTELLGAELASR